VSWFTFREFFCAATWDQFAPALSFAGFARGQLSGHDIDAVFLTGGSVRLTHVQDDHKGDVVGSNRRMTFGAAGKGLTLKALRPYGSRDGVRGTRADKHSKKALIY
jgi:hypothetical protein